ncbi:MAG: hypothetical protein N2747_02430 [Chitinophagaceae bacterium]|nr:hypothetical protein [Chitinophagaceae bacterium]
MKPCFIMDGKRNRMTAFRFRFAPGLLLFFALVSFGPASQAQVLIELGRKVERINPYSSINIYGAHDLNQKITYDKVSGSPFFHDAWQNALLYDDKQRSFGVWPVKLNLYSQEIHFLDSQQNELSVPASVVRKIVFLQPDGKTPQQTFISSTPEMARQSNCKSCLYQMLNEGHTVLLKNIRKVVREGDSLFGTLKRYYFQDQYEYFIYSDSQYTRLKKLDKEEFLQRIPAASQFAEWMKKQKLNFKKEKDYLAFLQHYNAAYRKEQ